MEHEMQAAIARLRNGQAPGHAGVIGELTVGIDFLTEFWNEKYLREYIPQGGSRIQFVTGRKGSGKTHVIEYFLSQSERYITASFSAREVCIHDFKEIYFEVLRQCGIEELLRKCGASVIAELGYSHEEVPLTERFVDVLARNGSNDPITKREIRNQLNQLFLRNPLMDNNFAAACALLTGGQLGHPLLEEPKREALLGWMAGKKEVKLSVLRSLGLSPARIAKHNARHMLRSLVEVIKLAGYDGLIIAVDDLDILVNRDSLEEIRYTRMKREDVYESIRELIDEIDTLRNIFFLFAFDRKLMDDESAGIKSYQALWLRIQNEIHSDRVNRFSNMIDLDKLSVYNTGTIMELSARVAKLFNAADEHPVRPLNEDAARELLSRADFSTLSLPRQVVIATVEGWE